jgi:hypothetical protein
VALKYMEAYLDGEEDDFIVPRPARSRRLSRRGFKRPIREFVVRDLGFREHDDSTTTLVPVDMATFVPLNVQSTTLSKVHDYYPHLAARKMIYSMQQGRPEEDTDYFVAVWDSLKQIMYIYKSYLAWRDANTYITEPHTAFITNNVQTLTQIDKLSLFRAHVRAISGEYIGRPESGVIYDDRVLEDELVEEDEEPTTRGKRHRNKRHHSSSQRSGGSGGSPYASQTSVRTTASSVMEATNRIVRGLRIRD